MEGLYQTLDADVLQNIRTFKKIKVGFGNGVKLSIKRSPRGIDCWWCEHQYDVTYTYAHEKNGKMYFSVPSLDTEAKISGWYIDTTTFSLFVLATHDILQDIFEEYTKDEYSIRVLVD
jgi:hypothetical protein